MVSKIFTYFNLIIITLVSYQVVDYIYTDFKTDVELLGVQKKDQSYKNRWIKTKKTQKTLQKSEYGTISNRNLFNILKKGGIDEATFDLSNIKKSRRNLKLLGTITGLGSRNFAIIEDTTKRKQDLYRVDDVVNNATIVKIFRNKVVIDVNGIEEILEVSEQVESKLTVNRSLKLKKNDIKKSIINVKRTLVENAFEDLSKLSKQIMVRPYYKNGKPDGVRIRRISRLSFFRKIGLRSGDVLKAVQGVEIKTIKDAINIQDSLRGASTISILLERTGKPLNIEYNIDNR
jgi:general secretion pathway protein C